MCSPRSAPRPSHMRLTSSRKAHSYSVTTPLYRVFTFCEGAKPNAPGGALHIPPQGRGRVDNPNHYQAYYATRQPEAAVAEVLGAREPGSIRSDQLRGSPLLKGSILALATVLLPSTE